MKIEGSLRSHFLKGGMFASSANLIFMLANFAIQIMIARLLGSESLGVFFLLFSIIAVCATFVRGGLDRAILRLVAEANGRSEWDKVKGLINTGIIMVAGVGIFVSALLWVFAERIGNNWFTSPLLVSALGVGAVIVLFRGLQSVISESFRGLHKIGHATFFQGALSSCLFLMMLLIIWLYGFHLNLDAAIFLNVLSLLITVIIAYFVLQRLLNNMPGKASKIDKKYLVSIAYPMLITTGSIFILGQADMLILGSVVSKSEIGYYGAANRLANMIALVLLVMNAVLPPIITELHNKGDIPRLERILRTTATLGFCICIPVSVIFIFWGGAVLNFLYGEEFVHGSKVLAYLTVGKFLHVFTGSSGLLLNMTGHHKTMMHISIVVAVLGLIGFMIVVRPYGKEGVAIVAASALIIQNVLQVIFSRRLIGIWTVPSFRGVFQHISPKA